MDDVYAINVAKSRYRDGYNSADVERVVSVFAPQFTDMSDGRPNQYRDDAPLKLRRYLAELFRDYEAKLIVIINAISVIGNTAVDYGWHELTLIPRNGGAPIYRRTRYLEVRAKQPDGEWRISKYMDNADLPDTVE